MEIVFLPKEKWKGTPVPLDYSNDSYYDLEISPLDKNGCTVSLVRKPTEPFTQSHSDSLYQDYWENAEAYGVISEQGEMLACIEMCPEEWSNRLLVTELWVSRELRGKGIGKQLMDKAKEVAARQQRRAVRQGFILRRHADAPGVLPDELVRRERVGNALRVEIGRGQCRTVADKPCALAARFQLLR